MGRVKDWIRDLRSYTGEEVSPELVEVIEASLDDLFNENPNKAVDEAEAMVANRGNAPARASVAEAWLESLKKAST